MPLYAEEQRLEIAVDGERVALFTLPAVPLMAPQAANNDPNAPAISQIVQRFQLSREGRAARNRADADWRVRVPVSAGQHTVDGDVPRAHGRARRAGAAAVRAAVSGRRQHSRDAHGRVSARRRDQRAVRSRRAPATRRAAQRIFSCRPARRRPTRARGRSLRERDPAHARAARVSPPRRPTTTSRRCSRSTATAPTQGFDAGIQLALKRLLVSPEFLFRVEQDPAGTAPGSVYQVSDLTLASRLSFFLWSSIPDDELLAAAERGELRDPTCSSAKCSACSPTSARRRSSRTSRASGCTCATSTPSCPCRACSRTSTTRCARD